MRIQWVYSEEEGKRGGGGGQGDVKTSHVYRENRDKPL